MTTQKKSLVGSLNTTKKAIVASNFDGKPNVAAPVSARVAGKVHGKVIGRIAGKVHGKVIGRVAGKVAGKVIGRVAQA
jgi:outer membrane lipoprotein SlyB